MIAFDLSAKVSQIRLQTHFFSEIREPIDVKFHMEHVLDEKILIQ